MLSATRTTTALLEMLLEPGHEEVWVELDGRYRPIVTRFAQRLGVSRADAEDIAQETMLRLVKLYRQGAYDRDRGRLVAWIVGIARRCVQESQRRQRVRREARGMSVIGMMPTVENCDRVWTEECERRIIEDSLERLRCETSMDEKTIRMFEEVGLANRPAREVAEEMEASVESVYAAKSRCVRALREIVRELHNAYEVE